MIKEREVDHDRDERIEEAEITTLLKSRSIKTYSTPFKAIFEVVVRQLPSLSS